METDAAPRLPSRPLGRTALSPSILGLGAAPLAGNRFESADDAAAAVVRRALDLGVTYIDTAPLYGRGLSERRVGLGLRGHPARHRCIVATKIGYVPEDFDYSDDATVRSVHASLERLGVERIPLVQVHELRPEIWDGVMRAGGALDALRRLQAQGLVGHVGATSSHAETLQRLLREAPDAFETLFVWRHFNLLDQTLGGDVVPAAAARGLGLIVGTPFATGILATGATPDARYGYQPAAEEHLTRTRRLEAVCRQHGVPLGAAALQFCLRGPGVATVVAGADAPEHVEANVRLVRAPVPDALWPALLAA